MTTIEDRCHHWINDDKRCTRPTDLHNGRPTDYCARHIALTLKRAAQKREKEAGQAARRAARDAERFARNGAKWAAELARVDAEIVRRGASPTDDMAAYGGAMNRSIARSVRRQMSDSNITRMVWLHKRRAELRRLLALGNVRQGAS